MDPLLKLVAGWIRGGISAVTRGFLSPKAAKIAAEFSYTGSGGITTGGAADLASRWDRFQVAYIMQQGMRPMLHRAVRLPCVAS